MPNKAAEDLLNKFQKDVLSPDERRLLDAWYWEESTRDLPGAEEFLEDHFRIKEVIMAHANRPASKPKVKLISKIAVAAVFVLLVSGLSFMFFKSQNPATSLKNVSFVKDIPAGKRGASITLANGQVLQLDEKKSGLVIENKIAYSDGDLLLESSTPQMLTAGTSRGQQYEFILSDGTKVWLNSDSKLVFPSEFNQDNNHKREVSLTGEGYFEVAKDARHPFIVKTDQQEIEVLGTHFNIEAYPAAGRQLTTLLEGSVHVTAGSNNQLLKPGEQALQTEEGLEVVPARIKETIAWKDGNFRFYQEPINRVMDKLSRWYNIEVNYQHLSEERFSGNISMSRNISEVLELISYSGAVKFKIEGRRVTVMK